MEPSHSFREARPEDLPALIVLLMDDQLGEAREDLTDMTLYQEAFTAIQEDPNHLILVIEGDGTLLGCAQLSYLPGLSYQGAWTAQLEGVRIRSDCRGQGLGKQLIEKAIELAKSRGCGIVQLSTSQTRSEAIAFYEQLGFENSHTGMKLCLSTAS